MIPRLILEAITNFWAVTLNWNMIKMDNKKKYSSISYFRRGRCSGSVEKLGSGQFARRTARLRPKRLRLLVLLRDASLPRRLPKEEQQKESGLAGDLFHRRRLVSGGWEIAQELFSINLNIIVYSWRRNLKALARRTSAPSIILLAKISCPNCPGCSRKRSDKQGGGCLKISRAGHRIE